MACGWRGNGSYLRISGREFSGFPVSLRSGGGRSLSFNALIFASPDRPLLGESCHSKNRSNVPLMPVGELPLLAESNGMDSSSPNRHLGATLVSDTTSQRKRGVHDEDYPRWG